MLNTTPLLVVTLSIMPFVVSDKAFANDIGDAPIVLLTSYGSPELNQFLPTCSGSTNQEVIAKLGSTNSYRQAKTLVGELDCASSNILAARAFDRICQNHIQAIAGGAIGNPEIDCPLALEQLEWQTSGVDFASLSGGSSTPVGYLTRLSTNHSSSRVDNGGRSKTVEGIQSSLRSHGCYSGRTSGLLDDATQDAMNTANEKGKGPGTSIVHQFFRWLRDLGNRNLCGANNRRNTNVANNRRNQGSGNRRQNNRIPTINQPPPAPAASPPGGGGSSGDFQFVPRF